MMTHYCSWYRVPVCGPWNHFQQLYCIIPHTAARNGWCLQLDPASIVTLSSSRWTLQFCLLCHQDWTCLFMEAVTRLTDLILRLSVIFLLEKNSQIETELVRYSQGQDAGWSRRSMANICGLKWGLSWYQYQVSYPDSLYQNNSLAEINNLVCVCYVMMYACTHASLNSQNSNAPRSPFLLI